MAGLIGRYLWAGNETLLKSITQAIPTFVLSCFRLPVATCEIFRQIVADQWWGREGGRKKMHCKSWAWLSTPKSLGGMGFHYMALFNQALLGKQGWRLLTEPNSLCACVLKGRYFPNNNFWNASVPRTASITWWAIIHGRGLLKRGVWWENKHILGRMNQTMLRRLELILQMLKKIGST